MSWAALESRLLAAGCAFAVPVDIGRLPAARALGFPRAVLFGMALPPAFVRRTRAGLPTEREEYLAAEERVEALADRLAGQLAGAGHRARSQSEAGNLAHGPGEGGYIDPGLRCGPSPVPHKTLAVLAGLGFVGKNNLLVTDRWGCEVALCSVLTDAPLPARPHDPVPCRCGSCRACVDACPAGALTGRSWTPPGERAALLDISRCGCPLACMMACPWTARYAAR